VGGGQGSGPGDREGKALMDDPDHRGHRGHTAPATRREPVEGVGAAGSRAGHARPSPAPGADLRGPGERHVQDRGLGAGGATAGYRRQAGTPGAGDDPRPAPSRRTRLRVLAPLTTHVFNRVTRLVAGQLPGFGVLTHIGRRTRRRYRTPLLVLRRGDDYVIALWYGSDVHWVKNVLAAGGCELRTRGHTIRLAEPRPSADPTRRVLPLPLRWAGAIVGLTEFLRLRAV
jgi:deazaflavin-dependent oxidoreductase (nitroreductase family)